MENKEGKDVVAGGQSDIFTEVIPKYGKVSMLFYIPDGVSDKAEIAKLIRENGGNIAQFHECFTYQLGVAENAPDEWYFQGEIYSVEWVIRSASKGELLDCAEFKIGTCQNGIDFPFNKKKIQYTAREII